MDIKKFSLNLCIISQNFFLFFPYASFWFVLFVCLLTHQHFIWCCVVLTQSQGHFYFSLAALPVSRLGVHNKLGGNRARRADPNGSKKYSLPYDTVLSNKGYGEKKERGNIWSDGIVFSKSCYTLWALRSWTLLNICLLM